MLEAERRTAISTSQLGLYSDQVDRYHRSRSSFIAKKIAISVMVVVTVIFVGIFMYDFTSASSINSKLNQETKHIYILQNAFKKPTNFTRKFLNATISPEVNQSSSMYIQDRSESENYGNSFPDDENQKVSNPEFRSQNLNNFKLRRRMLKPLENEENVESKQLFDNHALVYRIKHRHKYPVSNEDENAEENRPTPFHWELKTPQPAAFKRPRYPQLSQYRYPQASRNIQDIIKYLTDDVDAPNRGIKFTGVYVNPKKYDFLPEMGELMSNSDRSEEEDGPVYSFNEDPFYQYKPKHPADVNLLAPTNLRFAPVGLHRFNYDTYGRPSSYYKPTSVESEYESPGSYANNYSKKRKPQPFSVMLDIYPITDIVDQNKKVTRPKQIPVEDYELRRPIQYGRIPKFYAPPLQSIPAIPSQIPTDEEERQQMIFHLNLYPRKKNKLSREDIIQRSESMAPEDRQKFMDKVWSPLETIAKHLTVEQLKFTEKDKLDPAATRYQESVLDSKDDEVKKFEEIDEPSGSGQDENTLDSDNHKSSIEEDYAGTEKYELEEQKILESATKNEHENLEMTTISMETKTQKIGNINNITNIDTVEGFQKFSESISKID